MKKYLYIGILFGTIVLSGWSVNEESKEQMTEDIANRQVIEVETLPDSDKEEVVSANPLELTQEQKEDYHKQYVEIIEEINAGEDTNHLEVEPIDKFKPEDWVKPEEFRQLALVRSTMEFTSKAFGGDLVE